MARISNRFLTALAGLALGAAVAMPPWSAPARADETLAGAYLAAEQAARRGDIAAAADFYTRALTKDPANADLLERAIVNLVAAGRVETAVPLSRRLGELRPGHQMTALLGMAEAFKADDPAGARAALAGAEDDAAPFVGQLIDAWAAFESGDTVEARKILTTMLDDKTGGVAGEMMTSYHLGLLESAAGMDEDALAPLARATELAGTGTTRLVRVRAGALARTGDIEGARKLIADRLAETLGDERLSALDEELAGGRLPTPVVTSGAAGAAEALYGLSGFLSRGQNRLIGLAYARLATFLEPDLIDAKLLIAGILSRDGQHELAIAAYESIPRTAPEALEALIGRAQAMQDAEMIEPAIVSMREVTARYPRSIEAHTALGDMLRRESRFEEAAVAYDAAIQLLDPVESRHWVLYYQRGISYERSDRWEQAEADFFRALELEPDQPLVLNYLGYSWVEMRRNMAEAQAMIEKAVEQRPEDGYIVDSLGWVLYRLGDFEGAVKHLERAVELRPVDPVINDHFGDALWMVGRRTEARFQWKRALSFDPEEKDAARIRDKLARGLDKVLAEEAEAGKPAVVGADQQPKQGG